MIRRSTLIAVEVLLGLIAAMAIGVGIAWWRLSQGPVELGFIHQTVQSELSAARGGRPVGIERVELAWSREGNALEMRAVGVTVEDGAGTVLSRSEEAVIELGVLPLLIGRVSVVRAEFHGGAITVTRKADGEVQIAFGPENSPPDIVVPPPPPEETLEQRVRRVLDSMEAGFRPVGPGGGLRAVSVTDADLAIIDEGGGGRWTADGANVELARDGGTLALVAHALLEGAQGEAPAQLRITTDTAFQSAVIEFSTEGARPRALFSTAALGPLAGLDAPVTATVSIGLDREAGVNMFEGDASIGRGTADVGGRRFDLSGGRFHGVYDIASDELLIDAIELAGSQTRVDGEMRVQSVSAILRAGVDEPAPFNISLPSMRLDVPGGFPEPVALSNVHASGAIIGHERAIRFDSLHAEIGQTGVDASGRLYWADVAEDQGQRIGIQLEGAANGPVEARRALAMWPIGLGESARDFVMRGIEGGQIHNAVFRLDIRPEEIAARVLRNEAVDVRFDLTGGAMRFVSTMSPVTDARGSGVLRGNSFDLRVASARINGLALSNGRVHAPRFKPKGDMLTISARAEGDTRNMLQILLQEPLDLSDRLPVSAQTVRGRGVMDVRIQRPMLSDVAVEQWRYSVDGELRDFAGNLSSRRVALSNGTLRVSGDQNAISVSGPVRAGDSNVNVTWTEHIGRRNGASSEYRIAGHFDGGDLVELGYSIARYARGRVGVTVSGEGRGFDVDQARVDLDLTGAAIEAPRQFWRKAAGVAATASLNVARGDNGSLSLTNINASGGGLILRGSARVDADENLVELNLARLAVEGRTDARVSASRAADGGLDVEVRGRMFDAAPFMAADTQASGNGAAGASREPPLRASVMVERLNMRGGAALRNAEVQMRTARGALALLDARGATPSGGSMTLALGPRADDPRGRLRFRSDDAGFAVRALTGAENVVGGTASADGDWRAGPPSSARFDVSMRGFQVVRLPAMARLLSSAGSLTGLVETLNGDGIGFNVLDAEMVYADDTLRFTEGRMSGPSLGLTGAGSYDINGDDLDVDGVVAPSPTLNLSMLGNVPVIGDLLVSRRGEGVFGMTYSINGPAGAPRVGVNPVSALTPGILRRIFEPLPSRSNGENGTAAGQSAEGGAP